jgi:hypothetical protein
MGERHESDAVLAVAKFQEMYDAIMNATKIDADILSEWLTITRLESDRLGVEINDWYRR